MQAITTKYLHIQPSVSKISNEGHLKPDRGNSIVFKLQCLKNKRHKFMIEKERFLGFRRRRLADSWGLM